MQIHELNNYSGELGPGAYLAVDNGTDTGKISVPSLLASTNERIDNIIAGGDAPSAAEIVDARLGGDDIVYPSLGDAIRGQYDKSQSDLQHSVYGGFVGIDAPFIDGGYISASNGSLIEYANWKYTDYIDISERDNNTIYVFTTAPDNRYYNAYYDENETFISSFVADNAEFTPPANAKYVRMSVQNAYACGVKIYKNGIENDFDTLKNNIFEDSYFIKAQLDFEAGGISTSGHDYDADEQKNRLRSRFAYADRDYKLFQTEDLPSGGVFIWYKIFYWSDSDYSQNSSSQSDWYRFPNTPNYTIPKGSYFRILIYSEQYPDPITDVKSSFVYNHFDIKISATDTDNSSIIELNKDVLTFVQSLPTSYPALAKPYFGATHSPLSFAHFSDIHNRPELWERIAEYVDANSAYLPFALHTGDYVGDNQTSYTDLYNYYMPSVPFLNCVGNHDTYANAQHTLATKQSVYEKLFNHTSNWVATFMSGNYSMTYYKDFTDSNVRLIVFDNYYDIDAQKAWIASILEDAKSRGLHVITASHQVTGRPLTKVDCTFESLISYESAGTGSLLNTEFDAVIGAFISNGGKHIVHLCGHEHADFFYKTANGVLNCAVACATDFTGWTEGARVPNTKSWDCFNAISADTDLGVLKIVRIGQNVDCFNRVKNTLSYDYVNGVVLNNR